VTLPDFGAFGDPGEMLRRGQGGVNWQVAREVAYSLAGPPEPVPDDAVREMEALVRAAQMLLAAHTGMACFDEVAAVRVVDRRGWVDGNLQAFRYLIEPLARTLGIGVAGPAEPAANPLEAMMRPLAPLLLAIQVGAVVGHLSQRAFGQFDLSVPRLDADNLFFVRQNIAGLEDQVAAASRDTRLYVALHEVSRRALFNLPWVRTRLRDLLDEYISSVVVDLPRMQERLGDLGDPSRLQELLSDPSTLIADVASPRQVETMARLEAFLGFVEGYADYATEAAAAQTLPYLDDLRAALDRVRAETGEGENLATAMTGLTVTRAPEAREFCRVVAGRVGMEGLNVVWADAANIPTTAELDEPAIWLARIAVDAEPG